MENYNFLLINFFFHFYNTCLNFYCYIFIFLYFYFVIFCFIYKNTWHNGRMLDDFFLFLQTPWYVLLLY
jgi:hypothetical protein